jgi:hypothetical protein
MKLPLMLLCVVIVGGLAFEGLRSFTVNACNSIARAEESLICQQVRGNK